MWWWLSALPREEDRGHVCPVTLTSGLLGQPTRPCCYATGVRANLAPSSARRHTSETTTCTSLRRSETPAKWHEVGLGLLFTSTVEAAEAPVPPPTTKAGVCRGPGKHGKAGRRNFPLTQEIGTSCSATQSNHLSLFYWPPGLTHASWLHHYPSPEHVSTNSNRFDSNRMLLCVSRKIEEIKENKFGVLSKHTLRYLN